MYSTSDSSTLTFKSRVCTYCTYTAAPDRVVVSHRLAEREEQLLTEQMQLQVEVAEKQRIIQAQQDHIQSLDAANVRLLNAIGQLKGRYDTSAPAVTPQNGGQSLNLSGIAGVGDSGVIKSSYC